MLQRLGAVETFRWGPFHLVPQLRLSILTLVLFRSCHRESLRHASKTLISGLARPRGDNTRPAEIWNTLPISSRCHFGYLSDNRALPLDGRRLAILPIDRQSDSHQSLLMSILGVRGYLCVLWDSGDTSEWNQT